MPWGGEKGDPTDTGSARNRPWPGNLGWVFRQQSFLLIGLSYFSISYALYGITTFMVDYARHELGLPLETASLLATVHGIGQTLGVLTVLPLSDYLGRKRTVLLSNTFICCAVLGVLAGGHSWLALCISVGIMAMFFGVTFPLYGVCAGDYFPKEMMGTVIGAWTPFYGIGAVLAHWVSGMLRDTTGSYCLAFSLDAGMAFLAILLMTGVRRPSDIHRSSSAIHRGAKLLH